MFIIILVLLYYIEFYYILFTFSFIPFCFIIIIFFQTICDGVRLYTEKIENVLERNCYYDLDDNNQFDVTDSVSI